MTIASIRDVIVVWAGRGAMARPNQPILNPTVNAAPLGGDLLSVPPVPRSEKFTTQALLINYLLLSFSCVFYAYPCSECPHGGLMATIEKRVGGSGEVTYRVKVRLKGHAPETATFSRRTDARQWAQRVEADIKAGRHFGVSKRHTLSELLDRYEKVQLPKLSLRGLLKQNWIGGAKPTAISCSPRSRAT
jgi:hypothetical protein